MANARTPQITFCLARMLPIWERWTDGNPAMCQALECESAEPHTRERYRVLLGEAQARLYGCGDTKAHRAALLAGHAAHYALLCYRLTMVREVGERAIIRDHQTRLLARTVGDVRHPAPNTACRARYALTQQDSYNSA